jgi:hypothetical protein
MTQVKSETQLGRRTGTIAFWAQGEDLYENDASHIREIIATPARFGVTSQWIRETYEKYGERLGIEGNARSEIIKEAARHGWIRVRHYVGTPDYWSIQADCYSDARRSELAQLARRLMAAGVMHSGDEIRVEGYDDGTKLRYSFAEGGAQRLVSEATSLAEAERCGNQL